jgi:hypothetical protein
MLYDDAIMDAESGRDKKSGPRELVTGLKHPGAGGSLGYQPVSIRMISYDDGAGYLKLILCQLSGSTLSARCRRTGR